MIPTPCLNGISFDVVYEPSEDTFLFLDLFSQQTEIDYLHDRYGSKSSAPLIVEVGSGSGAILASITAYSLRIFGRCDTLCLGVDINPFACYYTKEIVQKTCAQYSDHSHNTGIFLGTINSDLVFSFQDRSIDLLIFNPPYVPTPNVPGLKDLSFISPTFKTPDSIKFEEQSKLLSYSYSGGFNGMEVTNSLINDLPRVLNPTHGVAYILLCAQNKPIEVQRRIQAWGPCWTADFITPRDSKAGWEKLSILRISREA